ncbi:sulfotransferase family 2 domain-containing protein [Luteolibacter marinus]|uniref:sulfotransferase family 2 domain-containing protein n=1 Tax=Luteolibacter marinus TaxID=2776705 RepID=UPI00186926C7|nr:sulfotransferase family 2 domain-containing protein [Luteolibacter marinus]
MISLKHGFLFVHIPKTAGNSIQNILRDYSEDHIVASGGQDGVERFEVRSEGRDLVKHSTLADYYRELGAEQADGLFKFACVRSPWERAISFYFSPHRRETEWKPKKFRSFVEKEVRPLRDYFLLGNKGDKSPFANVDFIIRYEHLGEDFNTVCQRVGIPPVELPVRNRSSRGDVAEYYDKDLSDFIARTFADEIDYFGYKAP